MSRDRTFLANYIQYLPTMLTIQVLGGFKISFDGKLLSGLTKPRGQSLLTYLLLHAETPQSRSHLAYTFWPDSSDKQARTNLRRELHQLRQGSSLIDNHLQSDTQTVQWIMPANRSIDAIEFEKLVAEASRSDDFTQTKVFLQKAIDLYQGDLVPGLYDEWIVAKREELRQSFVQALESLTKLMMGEREYKFATQLTQRLLLVDPLYEAGYAQLMQLYALQNDRARVLHTYHTCVTVLERELGVPPSEEVETLYQRQLDAENRKPRYPKPTVSTSSKLVGRNPEWQTLLSKWRQIARGQTHMVLIEGEAGIGKTRLAEELLEWVHRQAMPAARTRSYAAEGSLAYAPVIEWLRSDALKAALNGLETVWLTEISRLLPELLVEQPDLPPPQPMTERYQRQQLFEALARAFTFSNQPMLLLIDDLQWCDQETLEWLRFLMRFEMAESLLIVGTVRIEEINASHPLRVLNTDLQRDEQLTQIALKPLSPEESTTLASQEHGAELDDKAAEQIYLNSEGNPLFVVEMVRSGSYTADLNRNSDEVKAIDLPPKVYAVIQHRLAQLSPTAAKLVNLAATIGRSFSYEVLAAASDVGEDEVVNGLDELWQRRAIREGEAGSYDFSHDRIREAAYAALSPMRRRGLHQSIANTFVHVYQHNIDEHSARLAYHFECADEPDEAIKWYEKAGEVARKVYAYRESISHLKNALSQFDKLPLSASSADLKAELLVLQHKDLRLVYGFAAPEVHEVNLKLEQVQGQINSTEIKYLVLTHLRGFYAAGNQLTKAYETIQDQLDLLKDLDDLYNHMWTHKSCGLTNLQLGRFEDADQHFERSNDFYQKHPQLQTEASHNYVELLAKWAFVLWVCGFPEQAQVMATNGLKQYNQLTDLVDRHISLFLLSLYYRSTGNVGVVSRLGHDSAAIGTKIDLPYASFTADGLIGFVYSATSNPKDGVPLMRRNVDGYNKTGHTMFQPFRIGFLANAQLRAGQLEDALATIEEGFTMSDYSEQRFWDAELHRLHGEILLALGSSDTEIEACYQRALDIAEEQSAKMLSLRATVSLCRLWARLGKLREAHQMLQEIYDWFTEGFDTPDLVEARELLRQLSQ
ncbi:MAG: AAA family ATPase [Chloroflexota bacterium]